MCHCTRLCGHSPICCVQVLEGIKEVAIPIVVLAMGLFFSISTLVLLFN